MTVFQTKRIIPVSNSFFRYNSVNVSKCGLVYEFIIEPRMNRQTDA
jgi:hypothetical protein